MAISEYNYIPTYTKLEINNKPKDVITASYWNGLFNSLSHQGDHTAKELGNVLNHLTTVITDSASETADAIVEEHEYASAFEIHLNMGTNPITADKSFADIRQAIVDKREILLWVSEVQCLKPTCKAFEHTITLVVFDYSPAGPVVRADVYECYDEDEWFIKQNIELAKQNNVGDIRDLTTIHKSNLVSAINEVKQTTDTKQDKLIAGENITIAADGKTISSTGGGAKAFFLNVFVITETQVVTNKTYAEIKAAIDAGDIIYITDKNDVVYMPQVAKTAGNKIEFLWLDSHENRTYRWSAVVNSENAWSVTFPELATTDELGNLSALKTQADDNLVVAINEVKQTADAKANAADLAPVATSGSYSDLTDKPTIPSVPTATIEANAAARHEHSNKTVLDLISEAVKAAWDAASTWVTTNGANVLSHLSDSVKHITASERTAWNAKQDKLIAGDNITIAADGKTISATGGGGGVSGDNIETVEAQQIDIPSKLSDFENDSGFTTNSAVETALADKQDTISDLENIRSGAGKGATALQAVPSTYRTASAQDVIDNGLSDRVSAIEGKEAGWNGKYSKPTNGIPKTDLAQAVQTSLSTADSALQSVPSTYRTASEQDTIDSGKVDKVTGKGLSTNDYTNAAKAKVDAIPANPKYTDTVYDDAAVKGRVSALESKLNGSGAVTFAAVTTDSLTTKGEVEIYGTQPHIDFHYNNSTDDYTSRIIENSAGAIEILAPNGLKLNGSNLKYNDTAVKNRLTAIESKEDVPLTISSSRIKNVSYTAKYIQLLGAVLVRIYGTINIDMNAGYDYDIMTIDAYLPNSTAALAVKCSKNAMAIAKKGDGGGAIQIRPLEAGINGYDVWITGFWFV